jgi:hypothetical protein
VVNLLKNLATLASTLFIATCVATVTVQFVGVGWMASRGMLTRNKISGYTGVLYGLQPLDMAPGNEKGTENSSPDDSQRAMDLANRVRKMPEIADRQMALQKGGDDIRGVVMGLQIKRDRKESSRKVFESYLQQLENDVTAASLREIQLTLESLPPKQAKEIIRTALTDPDTDPSDDVMADIVSVIKSMPAAKSRKIFDELKTDEERELLHRILVEIGKLDEPAAQLSGKPP